MKKSLIVLLAFILIFSFVGCGKDEIPSSGSVNPDSQISNEDNTNNASDNGNPFEDFINVDLTLENIEVYDDIPENKINFKIESFKLYNIDNFYEADQKKIDHI